MDFSKDVGRIRNADSLERIREIVRAYPAHSLRDDAVLYSGMVGKNSANVIAIDFAARSRASLIDHTWRGRFLADTKVSNAIREAAERIFESEGRGDIAVQLRKDFLYGDATAPKSSPTSIQNCLWCEASRDFASSIRGDVKVIAVNANPNRVFAQVEIPTALQNPQVRSLGGVPVELLRTTYAQHGVESVLPQVQAAYIKEASLAGLLSTPAAEPSADVRRAPAAKFQVAQVATKALGAASTLYDGVASVRQAAQLVERGNDTGAQSHIVGAVARNVSGWGGAALGASTGAALSAETGPGALLGGAVGGIAGAIAGDKLATWIDQYRINHQTDAEGHRWAFDPAHPANGWTRTVTGELDARATVESGFPVYTSQTLTASPELADRLNYEASSRAAELALSAPPTARDPYRVASTPEDHRPSNVYESDWQRDAQSGQWSRHVADSHVGLSMQRFQTETATPARAAELDRHAQEIVAANLDAMPGAIAADYKVAYDRFGWSRHGDVPAAVNDAIQNPGRMVASDGLTYTRGDDGQWTTAGTLYGRSAAEGRIPHELEVAFRRFQNRAADAGEHGVAGVSSAEGLRDDEGSTASGSEGSDEASSIGALARKQDSPTETGALLDASTYAIGLAGPGVGRGRNAQATEPADGSDRRMSQRSGAHDASLPSSSRPVFDVVEQHRLYRATMERQREKQADALQRTQEAHDRRREYDERAVDERAATERTTTERAHREYANDEWAQREREADDAQRRTVDDRLPAQDERRASADSESPRRDPGSDRPLAPNEEAWRHPSRMHSDAADIGSRVAIDRSWESAPESHVANSSETERLAREARDVEHLSEPSSIDAFWNANLDSPPWDDARDAGQIHFQRNAIDSNGRAIAHDEPFPHASDPIVVPHTLDPYAALDPADPFSYNPYLPGMPEEDKDMADLWLAMQANDMDAVERAFDVLGQRPEVQQLIDEADRIIEQERIELAAQRQAELAEQQRRDEIMRAMREAEAQQHGPVKVLTLGLQPLTAMDMGGDGGGGGGGDGGGGG